MAGNFIDLKIGGTYKVSDVKVATRQDGTTYQRIVLVSENGKAHFPFFNDDASIDERIREGDIVKLDDFYVHAVRRQLSEYEKKQQFLPVNDVKPKFSLVEGAGGFDTGGGFGDGGFAPAGFDAEEGQLPF